jgi:hypothetical protein
VLASGERGRDRCAPSGAALAAFAAAGQVTGDAVEQRQRSLGVDFDDVVVELNAGLVRPVDVGRLVVGIERIHHRP